MKLINTFASVGRPPNSKNRYNRLSCTHWTYSCDPEKGFVKIIPETVCPFPPSSLYNGESLHPASNLNITIGLSWQASLGGVDKQRYALL